MNEIKCTVAPDCYLCKLTGTRLYTGLRDRQHGAPGVWSLLACEACGLVWLNPRPQPHELPRLYEGEYYTHDAANTQPPSAARKLKLKLLNPGDSTSNPRRLTRALSRLGPLEEERAAQTMWIDPGEGGRLLDVGCGAGEFLRLMKARGWQAEGIEPDPAAAAVASSAGVKVTCGTLEQSDLAPETFDVVTMSHVIEHVADPVALMLQCKDLLKVGGRLIVLTPNSQSLARRIFGGNWYAWEPPRHLMLFNAPLLKRCAAQAGYEQCRTATTSRSARHMWGLSRLLKRHGRLPPDPAIPWRLRLEGLAFWGVEYLVSKRAPAGEEVLLTATRSR